MTAGSPFRMDTAATARPVAIPCMAGHCLFQGLDAFSRPAQRRATLEYDNNGKQLSVSQLLEVRKTLKDAVDKSFRAAERDESHTGRTFSHLFTSQEVV